ncbi:amino acid transporter [Patellaria atrata CBS 101060]|uniref:Amino acid transporter n=1 Tax=Patellaria atrata CBS 101060 TaxID=1346257 RepID=A0A9P4SKL2_9PEZI|nr:amino acid transporter [Patellaria atrata CBS 101060]
MHFQKENPHCAVDDEVQLAAMGHKSELKRNFSPLAMLGLAFAIINSWVALSASLSLSLPSGGTTSVIWGLVTSAICNLALASSLAEFLSAYPTAGGQYHWVAAISPKPWAPLLSWITGWINVGGWIALVATGGLVGSQLIICIISFENDSYEPKNWHQFLIYIAFTVFAFVINAFMNSALPHINTAAIIASFTGLIVICITVLACASPNFSTGDFVFGTFINATGWPDSVAWILGLLQGALGLTAYDAVAHMIEEIPNASVEGPKIMVCTVAMGASTGLVFLIVLLFVIGTVPLEEVITSPYGPLLKIFHIATESKAGSIVLLLFPLACLLFGTTSIMTTSSRMTMAFARDGALPYSSFFAKVHPTLGMPLNALMLTTMLVIIFGCIFLGSSSAFFAIVSASVVALGISYAIPIAIHCMQGRPELPPRSFVLPKWLGWTFNIIGLIYIAVTTVFFLFPPYLPVTGTNMNYCIVAFTIWIIISTIQWFVDGRKNYTGPRHDVGEEVFIEATRALGHQLEHCDSDIKDVSSDGGSEKKALSF